MIGDRVDLLVGRSTVVTLDQPIIRVSLSTDEIADALVTSSRQVLIHGKAPGTISLLVWGENEEIRNYDVVVTRDLSPLKERFAELFPDEQIAVASNGTDIVVSGTVATKYVVDMAAAVAAGYVENPENVVNLLRQEEGVASSQIMLRVRFAEVSRSALKELGASFFTGPGGSGNWVARGTTQQFPAPDFDDQKGLVFSDFLNFFAFHTGENLGVLVKALESKGLFQSLAEPNLITQNGKEATFLAGGEYPYPVLQGGASNGAVTIMFKEFGVRLRFTPTIVGDDRINLQVAPEVSSLDFSNAITIQGFRIPALATRRTETEIELRDGQTFAIAGLLDNTVNETMSKVPGLGDIPILGHLFRSKAYQANQTELVVMITPHIMRRDSTGVAPTLPGFEEPFLAPERELLPPPPPYPQGTSKYERPGRDSLAANVPNEAPPPASEDTVPAPVLGAAATASARAVVIDPKAERKRLDEERQVAEQERKEAEKLARAQAKRDVQEAERLAKAERKRLDEERKVAERDQKEAEKLARAEAKAERKRLDEERQVAEQEQKEAEKLARAEAKAERKRLDEERQVAEQERKEAEKLARAQAKRDVQEAERLAKAERKRLEEERKVAEQERKEAEKLARAQAKRDAQEAERLAKADRKRIEEEREVAANRRKAIEKQAKADQKLAAELDKKRAERQKELQQILAEYLDKISDAQKAVDEIDGQRSELATRSVTEQRATPAP